MNTMETTALVERAINKDNEAIEILFKTYYKDVLYVCSKLGLNEEDAKDIAQESFITAFSTLSDIKDKSKFKQWVCGIANNKALNLLRHNKVLQIDSMDSEEYSLEIPGKEKATEDIVIDNEVADILKGLIDKLPLEQRIAVFMFYYEDMSVKEIAAAYGCPESTIRSRLNYAKKTMEAEINKMEDKGIKLRCIGALPFLFMLFAKEAKAFACEVPASTAVIAEVMKNNIGAAGVAGGAKVAAKTGIAGRIVAIACAVAVTAGGIFGIVKATGNKKANAPGNEVTVTGETDRVAEGEKETDTKPASDKPDKQDKEQKWYFEETKIPELEKLVGHEVICPDGKKTMVSDTPYNYTPEDIIKQIEELPFFKEHNCAIGTSKSEVCNISPVQYKGGRVFERRDSIEVFNESQLDKCIDSLFEIEMIRDVYKSNDYNEITVTFSALEYGKENQEYVEDVLAVLFGEELAHYLVYTENIQAQVVDKTAYNIEREITNNKIIDDEPQTVKVRFNVKVSNDERVQYKGISSYFGDYKSIIDDLSFDISDLVKGDIGNTDIFDIETFASKYMSNVAEEKYEYTTSSIRDELTVGISKLPNGRTYEFFTVNVLENYGIEGATYPELFISGDVVRMNDEIYDYDIWIRGSSGVGFSNDDSEIDFSKLYPSLNARLKLLLSDDADLSQLTYENTLKDDGTSERSDKIECTGNYFGKDAKVKVEYKFWEYDRGAYRIDYEINVDKKK